jgi:UDP-N-acetylglucosamine 2-epimerase
MKKAALIVGTRPQFVKTAPLVMELGRFFNVVLIHTGQHYDFMMSGNFFDELKMPRPDYHLWSSAGIGRMVDGLESVLSYERPHLVIVVGDTNSTLAGALAAVRLRLPLAHVEAGVRAKDKNLPEQINRVVTDSVADYFLCPTQSSVENLRIEGKREHLFETGDVIFDCLRLFQKNIPEKPTRLTSLPERYVLATIHRAEAVDIFENLKRLMTSLATVCSTVIFPIHPRTRKRIVAYGLIDKLPQNLALTDPVGYLDILSLIRRSAFVITDSGGVQREAAFMRRHVIVARPETEWHELEKSGWVKVAGYTFDLSNETIPSGGDASILDHLTRPASAEIARILSGL